MAKLIITLDGLLLSEFEIDKERITIGRNPHNDIPIDNLAISGEHAAITTVNNEFFVEDLGSTNGTLVNEQPITKHTLHHGDEIEIGKYRLKYVNVQELGSKIEAHETGAQGFEKPPILHPNQIPTMLSGEKPTSDMMAHTIPLIMPEEARRAETARLAKTAAESDLPPAEAVESHGVVQILNGPNASKELALTKTLTSLGKPGVQVAVITRRPHGYFLTHVQGDHYPTVNGQDLDAHPRQLEDHDVIELAGVKMEFYLK
ncbi:FHA domain-containing protein [Sulfuricella denitrificans skB26]|uniref:FHA domain-containing protein n=1 Tax=Sulfuricella denitrificans (strain DSM 22764 / NBRC 105220 / skB26) TaxID=1163617 RepID=S6AMZ9_SULDS|nr:FHA domain-containing protein [Sulfuricella denitrificans]BAN36194.1 FHA domain-containing protein [Sulfuricella denitrificans skB26]